MNSKSDLAEDTKHKWGPISAVLVALALFILPQITAAILITLLFMAQGKDPSEAISNLSAIQNFALIIFIEGLTILGLVLFMKKRKAELSDLGIKRRPKLSDLGYAVAGWFVYFPVLVAIISLLGAIVPSFNVDQTQSTGFEAAKGLLLFPAFISLVILPPLVEESIFRGLLYKGLKKKLSFWQANIITSFAFGLAHMQWNVGVDTFILSLVLVFLVYKTNNLWAAIFLHGLKNLIAFIFLFR